MLLTPRLGRATFVTRLGSATRRSGAYRDGTCTRWRRTTGCERSRAHIVTTRHAGILSFSVGEEVRVDEAVDHLLVGRLDLLELDAHADAAVAPRDAPLAVDVLLR